MSAAWVFAAERAGDGMSFVEFLDKNLWDIALAIFIILAAVGMFLGRD